ncbi:MAG TPA: hypothetical protein VJN89_02380 [Candidatus Acidoferrum sp.]|nr:hypothetical protein [Candidatus Acidoferrum sp.]
MMDSRWLRFSGKVLFCLLCGVLAASALRPQSMEQKDPQGTSPEALLQRAWDVMGAVHVHGMLIHYRASASLSQNYQSDRMYPPFLDFFQQQESWFSPQTAVERTTVQSSYPLAKPQTSVLMTDANRAFSVRDNGLQASPRYAMQPRYLNPWLVIADWLKAGGARMEGTEVYRDFPRRVLVRQTADGEQRLFLDPKSGFPVKLDLFERHYLWGQRHLEYVYTTWVSSSGVALPGASYLLADGSSEVSQTIGEMELIPEAGAPSLTLPSEPKRSEESLPRFLQPLPLTVTEVGPATFILANLGYRETVTKIGDQVFLLDGTQGEQRAREDSEVIDKLFPGKHKTTVIVTDLAWPHLAGLRYWVASGATIVAHKTARNFLQSVIDRKWTLAPDFLEQHRDSAKFQFIPVDSRYELAAGALTLHPIDGIGSEGALMAFIQSDHFLWASDFIQSVDEPTEYASEVWKAVHRDGLHPERTAAEHLNLTPWSKIEELQNQQKSVQ